MATLRTLARGLFRYELGSGSLVGALQELANAADSNYRVECTLEADGNIALPDRTADLHLYRISQEAITNAVKHGGARKIQIQLKRHAGQIIFRVEDNGSGAPVAAGSRGVGLRTMEFRTRRLGGRFAIESRPGKGTSIICTLPEACPPAERPCQKQLVLFP
jgi:signal transduction histidine kinase